MPAKVLTGRQRLHIIKTIAGTACNTNLRQRERKQMKRSHLYIFYFYPKVVDGVKQKGIFIEFTHVKDGKARAAALQREYDYQKWW